MLKLLVSLIVLLTILPKSSCKLEMVIEVFRHGARQPIGSPDYASQWLEAVGELTSAGMRQHYLLGREMRKKYIDTLNFLPKYFNHSEIYVRSTDVNRTIMSVTSHLLGLYPLGAGSKFPDDYPLKQAIPPYQALFDIDDLGYNVLPDQFQPIPVHIVEKAKDFLLVPGGPACPNYNKLRKNQTKTDIYKNFNTRFQPVFEEVRKVLNISGKVDMSELGTITSDLMCDIMENHPVAKNLSHELWEKMIFLKGLDVQYVDVGNELLRKILGTNFFKTVLQYFDAKIHKDYPLKYAIFSAHDTTLQPYMAVLNLTNWECLLEKFDKNNEQKGNCVNGFPIFASQIILELHSNVTDVGKVYFVKVIYNGVEMKLCESEQTECLFEEFSQRLSQFVMNDDDFQLNCKGSSDEKAILVKSLLKQTSK